MSQERLKELISSLKVVEHNCDRPTYFQDFENIVIKIGSLQNPDQRSPAGTFVCRAIRLRSSSSTTSETKFRARCTGDSISLLAQFLNDETEKLNLMWGIIHTIEIFDKSIYVREILRVSPQLDCDSPEWAETIFIGILNSDDDKIELIQQLKKTSSSIKKPVRNILGRIQADSPEFSAKIHPVLAALN